MVGSALHHTIASPSGDAESREDEDVSSFLDSFSACGMASKLLASAPEMVTGAQSSPFSLPPRGEAPDGRVREAENVVDDDAQATLAISEPLAQVKRKEAWRATTTANTPTPHNSGFSCTFVCGSRRLC